MPAQVIRLPGRESAHELPDPDQRLIEQCRRGDRLAFETLFRKHQTFVYNVALGMLGNGEDASDITQDAFLRLHRSLDTFRGDSTVSTWLYRVAVNLSITELRRRTRSRFQLWEDVKHDEESSLNEELGPNPLDAVELEEDRKVVHQVLRMLPPDYRAIMVLRHFQQLAYEEIAEVLNLSLSQVKTRLFRARKMFKDRFEAFVGGANAL